MRFVSKLLLPALFCAGISQGAAQTSARDDSLFRSIDWLTAPAMGEIGGVAKVTIPQDCKFTGRAGVPAFMELTENPPDSRTEAVMLCYAPDKSTNPWFVLFSYDSSGYVRDDEKNSLDADKIIASIREGTHQANLVRLEKGWDTLGVAGWITPPFYDEATNNLTWALLGRSANGSESANRSVRLLGRAGVVSAELVGGVNQLDEAVPRLNSLIAETRFVPGQRYSEWRVGDKVAEFGLVALVAGGAGAAAAKLGLFGKLWKLIAGLFVALWKVLVAIVVGIIAWVKSLFRKKEKTPSS